MVLLAGNPASGTITSDAQFVNYQQDGSGDYHLKSTSPAIDAGTPVGAPSTDFDGNPRPQGKGYDIGPYEYSASLLVSSMLALAPCLHSHANVQPEPGDTRFYWLYGCQE